MFRNTTRFVDKEPRIMFGVMGGSDAKFLRVVWRKNKRGEKRITVSKTSSYG